VKTFSQLLKKCQESVNEIMPWDWIELINSEAPPLIIDIRESTEYDKAQLNNSFHVPHDNLETASEYGFEETLPILVTARDKPVVVVCRSGNRSLLAAHRLQEMGYLNVKSLMTGLRGWNDYDQALIDQKNNILDNDFANDILSPILTIDQLPPKS